VAWIAPAPIEARAATATSALGRSGDEAVGTGDLPLMVAALLEEG
jgi:hypothetical protein